MFVSTHMVFMMVAGVRYIMGVGDTDFGDYVMDGMTTAERSICSSFVCHHGSGHSRGFFAICTFHLMF